MESKTIYRVFKETVERHGPRNALSYKKGAGYSHLTYDELWGRVRSLRRRFSMLSQAVRPVSMHRPVLRITVMGNIHPKGIPCSRASFAKQ